MNKSQISHQIQLLREIHNNNNNKNMSAAAVTLRGGLGSEC